MTPEQSALLVTLAIGCGAAVKHFIEPIPNKFIPLITFTVMVVGGFWGSGWDFSFSNTLDVLVLSAGPTGFHQLAKTTSGKSL